MKKKHKKVYVVLRKRKLYYNRPIPTCNGGEQDSYYHLYVNEFVAVFNNKEDALYCALAQDGCYVQEFKL